MTLQQFRTAALRGRAAAFVLAALVALHMGATAAAQHVHGEDDDGEHGEHCTICAIFGVDDICAPTPTSPQRFAAPTSPIGGLDQCNRGTPPHANRARAPPLSR